MTEESSDTSDGYETISGSDELDEFVVSNGKADPINELIGAVDRCQVNYKLLANQVQEVDQRFELYTQKLRSPLYQPYTSKRILETMECMSATASTSTTCIKVVNTRFNSIILCIITLRYKTRP